MVTTVDGKILSGERDESVIDLGSRNDHLLMQRILAASDAVMVGAQTLRASPTTWIPKCGATIVVTRSGHIPYDSGFFQGGSSFVAAPSDSDIQAPDGVEVLKTGDKSVDFQALFEILRNRLEIERLSVLGGSELNAQLIRANLIDELFVTIAPKVKLGRDVPTYADGDALARCEIQNYRLVEHHAIANEIFIRYRREAVAGR